MSKITDLKDQIDTKTMNLLLLGIPTGGLYYYMRLYANYRIIDKTTKTQTATDCFMIWIAIFSGTAAIFFECS